MPKVFVYGTLLSGEPNNYLLKTSELLGKSEVSGLLMHDLGPFPACIQSLHCGDKVVGEVWEVSDETFQRLDYLEGYPDFYGRIQVETSFGEAWVYIHNEKPNEKAIISGNWKQHLQEKYG